MVETNKGLRFCNTSKPENGGRRVERRRIKNIAQNTLTLTIGNYESFLIFVFCLVFDSVARDVRDVIFAMMVCMPNWRQRKGEKERKDMKQQLNRSFVWVSVKSCSPRARSVVCAARLSRSSILPTQAHQTQPAVICFAFVVDSGRSLRGKEQMETENRFATFRDASADSSHRASFRLERNTCNTHTQIYLYTHSHWTYTMKLYWKGNRVWGKKRIGPVSQFIEEVVGGWRYIGGDSRMDGGCLSTTAAR